MHLLTCHTRFLMHHMPLSTHHHNHAAEGSTGRPRLPFYSPPASPPQTRPPDDHSSALHRGWHHPVRALCKWSRTAGSLRHWHFGRAPPSCRGPRPAAAGPAQRVGSLPLSLAALCLPGHFNTCPLKEPGAVPNLGTLSIELL